MKTEAHAKTRMRKKAGGYSCPPGESGNPPTVDRLCDLARHLVQVRQRAESLGLFTDDRELLECPNCGLLEDVTSEGMLVTYPKDSADLKDCGLRFLPDGKTSFACPACGTRIKAVIS
jgi:predicted RNA-binding Zn-ribbon protein involved in translation (DUF1610 family)